MLRSACVCVIDQQSLTPQYPCILKPHDKVPVQVSVQKKRRMCGLKKKTTENLDYDELELGQAYARHLFVRLLPGVSVVLWFVAPKVGTCLHQ